MRVLFAVIFALTVSFTSLTLARASENYFSSHHVTLGQKMLTQGQQHLAVEHFLRAVLFDPSNLTARQLLRQAAAKEADGPAQRRHQLYRFLEQIDYYEFLRSRILSLNENNQLLRDFVVRNGQGDPKTIQEAEAMILPSEIVAPEDDVFTRLGQMPEGGSLDVAAINQDIRIFNQKVLLRLQAVQESNRRLRQLNLTLTDQFKGRKESSQTRGALAVEPVRQPPASAVRHAGKGPADMTGELDEVRAQFAQMQERLSSTDRKVAELTKNLAGMSLEVFEKNRQIADKEVRINSLDRDLKEARSRLELVQKIMREKDAQIQALQTQGENGGQPVWTLAPAAADDQTAVLQGRVKDLEDRYRALEIALQDKDAEVAALTEQIAGRDQRVTRLKNLVYARDRELVRLNGVVEIYKGKFYEANEGVRSRDLRLSELEDAVAHLRARLDQLEQRAGEVNSPSEVLSSTAPLPAPSSSGSPDGWSSPVPWTRQDVLERTREGLEQLQQYLSNHPSEK